MAKDNYDPDAWKNWPHGVSSDAKSHTIIGSTTRVRLMCGECGKGWEELGGNYRPTCPHCKASLPAWGLRQNISEIASPLLNDTR